MQADIVQQIDNKELKTRIDRLVRVGLLTAPSKPGPMPCLHKKGVPPRGESISEQVANERRDR